MSALSRPNILFINLVDDADCRKVRDALHAEAMADCEMPPTEELAGLQGAWNDRAEWHAKFEEWPPPSDAAAPDFYMDTSGVPVCRHGAPPAYADSRGFYATSAFADAAGRTLLLAWVGAWPSRGWNCCMSLPRVLSFDAAGRLRQQPIPELAQLRGAPVATGPRHLNGAACRIKGFTGDSLEVIAELELDAAGAVELALRDDAAPPPYASVMTVAPWMPTAPCCRVSWATIRAASSCTYSTTGPSWSSSSTMACRPSPVWPVRHRRRFISRRPRPAARRYCGH